MNLPYIYNYNIKHLPFCHQTQINWHNHKSFFLPRSALAQPLLNKVLELANQRTFPLVFLRQSNKQNLLVEFAINA
ncbi:hypothetical protein DXB41_11590 [Segatella copri]|nr:hypothetical protein DXB41_11590 [Segatella copri]